MYQEQDVDKIAEPDDGQAGDTVAQVEGVTEEPKSDATDPVTHDDEAPNVETEDAPLVEDTPVEDVTVNVLQVKRLELNIADSVTDALVNEFINTTIEQVAEWSTELLLAVLKGEIPFPENQYKHLVHVYRQRVSVPEAWRTMQVVEFLRTGVEPAKTSKGVWVVDQTRHQRSADLWSTAELESWALGEVKAGGRTHDNGLALELKARLSLRCEDKPKSVIAAYKALSNGNIPIAGAEASTPVYVPAASDVSEQLQHSKAIVAKLETVKGLTPMNVAFIDDTLSQYIEAVKPGKPVSEAAGLKAQNALDNMFQYVISLEPQAMVTGLERIKAVFKKNMEKGCVFEASNVFRFTHLLRAENNRRARHVALLELMRIYFADTKEGRKQCDPRALLTHQAIDKAEMLVEYFNTRA